MPRNVLTFTQKLEVIKEIDTNASYSTISQKFNIGKSTISDINRKRKDILEFVENNLNGDVKRKRIHFSETGRIIDERTFHWVSDSRRHNIAFTGIKIQQKAREIAADIGAVDFQASNGWLQGFCVRHNVALKVISRESVEMDLGVDRDQLSNSEVVHAPALQWKDVKSAWNIVKANMNLYIDVDISHEIDAIDRFVREHDLNASH